MHTLQPLFCAHLSALVKSKSPVSDETQCIFQITFINSYTDAARKLNFPTTQTWSDACLFLSTSSDLFSAAKRSTYCEFKAFSSHNFLHKAWIPTWIKKTQQKSCAKVPLQDLESQAWFASWVLCGQQTLNRPECEESASSCLPKFAAPLCKLLYIFSFSP